jgi:hypothetical protein
VNFGIAEAPRICTKLLRPLTATLKQLGIRCIIYIDDILLFHQDALQLATCTEYGGRNRPAPTASRIKLENLQMLFSTPTTISMFGICVGYYDDENVRAQQAVEGNTPYGQAIIGDNLGPA